MATHLLRGFELIYQLVQTIIRLRIRITIIHIINGYIHDHLLLLPTGHTVHINSLVLPESIGLLQAAIIVSITSGLLVSEEIILIHLKVGTAISRICIRSFNGFTFEGLEHKSFEMPIECQIDFERFFFHLDVF